MQNVKKGPKVSFISLIIIGFGQNGASLKVEGPLKGWGLHSPQGLQGPALLS